MATLRRSVTVSILFVVFGGPGIAVVYVPLWITHFRIPAGEPPWQMIVAAALIVSGLTPGLESVVRFVREGRGTLMPTTPTERLVVSGFYRYVRNPMYIGALTALAGEAVLFRSVDVVTEAALILVGLNLFIRFYEEPMLSSRYPVDYPRYKRNVPRWLPRLTPWKPSEN